MEYGTCWNELDCPGDYEICMGGLCGCRPNYYNSSGSCLECPGFNKPCITQKCCSKSYLGCVNGVCQCMNGLDTITCSYIGPSSPLYFTASQFALSAALIMGMAALSMVVYRLCTKPRYLSARQRALASQMGLNVEGESLSYSNYLRASLTSIQIRVLTRMRDRPPTYDNRPRLPAPPEAPPPYEGVSEGIAFPPPYIEVVVSNSGYTNSTFNDLDPDGRNGRSTTCPNCDGTQQRIETNRENPDKIDESTLEKIEISEGQINRT